MQQFFFFELTVFFCFFFSAFELKSHFNCVNMSFDRQREIIQEGDVVILYFTVNTMHAITVTKTMTNRKNEIVPNTFQTPYGALKVGSLIGKNFGTRVELSKGWGYVLYPTPELWTLTLPHRTQIIYTPDISMIIFQLELKPGSVVVESGTGSGSLSHALIRSIKPTGHLFTFDFHEQRSEMARQEFNAHDIGNYVTTLCRDVCKDGFGTDVEGKADAVFLDLPHPWEAIPHAQAALRKSGGRICSFSPCIEQVQKACLELSKLGFVDIETMECLQQKLLVGEKTMPVLDLSPEVLNAGKKSAISVYADPVRFTGVLHSNNTAGHTGYLTTATLPPIYARKIEDSQKSGPSSVDAEN